MHEAPSPRADAPTQALQQRYDALRGEIEALMAQPVRDLARIHHLVDELERVQLQFKQSLGILGNNPNE